MTEFLLKPQKGAQTLALTCPCDIIGLGGNRKGGKSFTLILRHVQGAQLYGSAWASCILRMKYKEFKDMLSDWRVLKTKGLPIEIRGGEKGPFTIEFDNGARVYLFATFRLKELQDLQGHKYALVDWDEAGNCPFIIQALDIMKALLAGPAKVKNIMLTFNPGGVSNAALKHFFQIGYNEGVPRVTNLPTGGRSSKIFIRSDLRENTAFNRQDPEFIHKIGAIKDKILYEAWVKGNFDVFLNQAFHFIEEVHMVEPIPIPKSAKVYMTFDYGYGAPFSVGWHWIDMTGRIYRFMEWYGCKDDIPNTGLRMVDREIAEGIIEREKRMGVHDQVAMRLAGHDCNRNKVSHAVNKDDNTRPTTEIFAEYSLFLHAIKPDRPTKYRALRDRMFVSYNTDGTVKHRPMLVAYNTCKAFKRIVPAMGCDPENPEQLEKRSEDHLIDDLCLIVNSHYCKDEGDRYESTEADQVIQEKINGGSWDDFSYD